MLTMMHASAASAILPAVQIALSKLGVPSVTVVGHSLGGALALLDGIYFRLNFVDSKLRGLVTHVNNREDWIPIVPGMLGVGFHHPSGEIHIQDSGAWIACPGAFPFFLHLRVARSIRLCLTFAQPYSGQDNPSHLCIVGDVGNILNGNLSYHDGPYANISMGC
jgi:hypothetical protein